MPGTWEQACSGSTSSSPQLLQELTSAAVAVTKGLAAAKQGDKQRHKKVDHPQPGKKNVEKAKDEIYDCPDPEIVIPVLLFHIASLLSFTAMHPAGQVFAHRPQPTQVSSVTRA